MKLAGNDASGDDFGETFEVFWRTLDAEELVHAIEFVEAR
jgi:hypothetical protein